MTLIYIDKAFTSFLKKAQTTEIYFMGTRVLSMNKGDILHYLAIDSDLGRIAVDRKELWNTLKVLDEYIEYADDKLWLGKGKKRKAISTREMRETELQGVLDHEVPLFTIGDGAQEFYNRYIAAASYRWTGYGREHITGVYVDTDGVITAADGRIMLVWKADPRFALPEGVRPFTMAYDKVVEKITDVQRIAVGTKYVEIITDEGIVYRVRVIDEPYPNYKRIVNSWEEEYNKYRYIGLSDSVVESLKLAEKLVDKSDTYKKVMITEYEIKTFGDHPYVDEIDLDILYPSFKIVANVEALNKCIADVDPENDKHKYLMYQDANRMLVFDDKQKTIFLMPIHVQTEEED